MLLNTLHLRMFIHGVHSNILMYVCYTPLLIIQPYMLLITPMASLNLAILRTVADLEL